MNNFKQIWVQPTNPLTCNYSAENKERGKEWKTPPTPVNFET